MNGGNHTVKASFFYYPMLPNLGFEDLILQTNQFPLNLAFDTKYSYNIGSSVPCLIYDVSFYKNPAADASRYPSYVPKDNPTPTSWNGLFYQQFFTLNYEGSLFTTNGIQVPFDITYVGMQFCGVTVVGAITGTTVVLTLTRTDLIVGDFVFFNEFDPTGVIITGINMQSGYVTAKSGSDYTFTLPNATLSGAGGNTTLGIVQYLTNRSDITKDCLRWYDGDPTDGSDHNPPEFSQGKGWVNYCPPLSQLNYSISGRPALQYYMVGCRTIFTYKDQLLFAGPVIQTSTTDSQIYLRDTILFSQNGTPYYTCSFPGDISTIPIAATPFTAILTPPILPITSNGLYSATPSAMWEDQPGFGGFIQTGLDQAITNTLPNQDVFIVGQDASKSRLVASGNDATPFVFYTINSEFGTSSPFSAILMDEGVLAMGSRGFTQDNQDACNRFDLSIPDEIFEVDLNGNGTEQICCQRDFINEWMYFSYRVSNLESPVIPVYPDTTLQFNYRDGSWATFYETYTTYGTYRPVSGFTWGNIGLTFKTWEDWNQPWNFGTSNNLQPIVIGGNQQGFLIKRGQGTDESVSLAIESFSGNLVTCRSHNLSTGDWIVISGCIGTISTTVNGNIYKVVVQSVDTFDVLYKDAVTAPVGTYVGGGLITLAYVPFIQTKQFPLAWNMARKTRIGAQQYMLTTTANAQITLLMYLSQNDSTAYNAPPLVPDVNAQNNSLIYNTVLYTCPESTNLGLTPANTNLQMIVEPKTGVSGQQQIWHRINTSLIGDTVQLGFTLSDDQMYAYDSNLANTTNNAYAEIELHSIIMDVSPSMLLA